MTKIIINLLLCCNIISCNSLFLNNKLDRKHIRQVRDVPQDIWHAYKFNSGLGNREDLIIQSIVSNNVFNVGQEVMDWQSLNVRDKSLAVGRMSSGFTVMIADLTHNNTFLESTKLLILEEYPTAYSLIKMWNSETLKYDIHLIFATASTTYDLHWFKITEDLNLEKMEWFNLTKKVTHLKMFEVGQILKLLLIYERSTVSEIASADIFDVISQEEDKKLSLIQTLNLNSSSKSSAINIFANEIYLSIPQQISNCVLIYKLFKNKFSFYESILSGNVSIVSDFVIGHRSFLAVGGVNSAVYQFSKTGFVKVHIIDMQFEEVTYFLPLPVKTYRDEVILLVQHHIDYGSHIAPHVKALIYFKESFYVHEEIPCSYHGVRTNGATCLADPEREAGIFGSAVLSLGKSLAVLVPRYQVESGLFYINWKLKPVDNPIAKKVDKIIKSRLKIGKLLQEHRKIVADINEKLVNTLNPNINNVIEGNWKVNTLITTNVIQPNMQYTDANDNFQKSTSFSFQSDFQVITDEIDSLQVKILQTRAAQENQNVFIDHLKIDGQIQVHGGSAQNVYVGTINDLPFDYLIQDCVRRSQRNEITGSKTFKQAEVEKMTFAKLNNISAENVAYNTRHGTQIHGNVSFKNSLLIQNNVEMFEDGNVNEMDLKTDLIYMNSDIFYEDVKFKSLETENLNYVKYVNAIDMERIIKYKDINQGGLNINMDYLDLSNVRVTTEHINHEEFKSFIKSLCLRNTECRFPGNVTIHGKVHVKGTADITTLNELPYPDGFVMDQIDGFTKIVEDDIATIYLQTYYQGKKVFTGNVSATEVVVEGLVDDVNPDEVITCTTKQTIPENFTFFDLEVTESFQVDGDIYIGPNLTKFIPNPTLEDEEILNSNALFSQLEIDGRVMISDLFNESTLKGKLDNIVYKDEDIITINAEKKITKKLTIHNNLNIHSNVINNIEIKKILTLNSKQTIPNHKINGDVIIENLDVVGLFNGENFTKHSEQFIRLHEDEIINSEISFVNMGDLPDILANELEIGALYNKNISDFILTIGDTKLRNSDFNSMRAQYVEFVNDVNYDIECFDIEDYATNRFSLSKTQIITGKMRVINGSVNNIRTEQINDIDWGFVKSFLNISNIFSQKFILGQFKIKDLNVQNSVNVENLNTRILNHLFQTIFWVNKSNNIQSNLDIQGTVVIEHIKLEQYLNNRKFFYFINDIILNTEKDIVLQEHKHLNNGLKIQEYMHTNKINDLLVDNILLGSSEQNITAHVVVHGDLSLYNALNVKNDIHVKYIQRNFKIQEEKFVVKGNTSFQYYVTIENIHVKGNANNIKPKDYLKGIVGLYDDITLNTTTVFKKEVHIYKNLGIASTVNDVNLEKILKDIVLISSDDYIEGLVVFKENVEVLDTVELQTDLNTNILCGCDVQEWLDKAVYIIDGHFPGEIKFQNMSTFSNSKINILNKVEMKNVIPLHTNQIIDTTLNMGLIKFQDDVKVGNFVNEFQFKEEYGNTVMVNKDQDITSQVIFLHPIIITYNLKTLGVVNGKDLTRIVTVDTDQNLTASYVFNGKTSLDTNLFTSGRVNNINIINWSRRSVTANKQSVQDVQDKWKVLRKITFQDDITTDSADRLIGNMNLKHLSNDMLSKQQKKIEIENVIKNDYNDICINIQNLVKIGKERPFLFRHLENHKNIHFENDISAIHHFEYLQHQYLIVSQKHNCHSFLYVWKPNTFIFIAKMRTGEVEQFITVVDSVNIYLVTRNTHSPICEKLGVNVWIFNNDEMTHVYGFNHSVLLQKSKLPGTFYSLNKSSITEYKLYYEDDKATVHTYKHWQIPSWNNSYHQFDFTLDTLETNDSNRVKRGQGPHELDSFSYEATSVTNGDMTKYYLPASNIREYVTFSVGTQENQTKLAAVVIWEDSLTRKYADEIKIYHYFGNGKLFDKIITTRPSNINILQFGKTDETIMAFLKDYTTLMLYEYKGYEGFQIRSVMEVSATKMISISLPYKPFQSRRKFVLLVNKQTVKILQATMYGDRPIESFNCES